MPETTTEPDDDLTGTFDTVILAVSNASMKELMWREVDDLCDEIGPSLVQVRYGEKLGPELDRPNLSRTLLLIDADMADSAGSSASEGRPGIRRLRDINAERQKQNVAPGQTLPPVIVLNASYDAGTWNQISFIQTPHAVLDISSGRLAEDLRRATRDLRDARDAREAWENQLNGGEATPSAPAERKVKSRPPTIEIKLRAEECEISILPEFGVREDYLPTYVSPMSIDEIFEESKLFKQEICRAYRRGKARKLSREWYERYENIGKLAFELLERAGIRDKIENALKYFSEDEVRIRFNFAPERRFYDCIWEAAFDRFVEKTAIETPMARRLVLSQQPKVPEDLAGGDRCLDILAIAASVREGEIPDGPGHSLFGDLIASLRGGLDMLPGIEDEMRALEELETAGQRADGQPAVAVDILRPGKGSQFDELKRKLQKRRGRNQRPFDVVHFAGHGVVVADKKGREASYLIFAGEPAQAIPVQLFADLLHKAGVQLVYLSACSSNTAVTAFELARHNIPVSIGFSWDLHDGRAPEFAKTFYQNLLADGLMVCGAFSKTRAHFFAEDKYWDPTWAAPVMLAQPELWRHISALRETRH